MITVVIVDDHPVYRQGLAMAVERAPDLALAGEAKSIEDFDKLDAHADVVLLDLHLPGIEGAAGVAQVCGQGYRVLVVSAAGTPGDVVDAIAAGASGYLTKETDAEEITSAVRVVAGGDNNV
jgi:DNA-binding NarL/FixJ family response regulator